jgi:hypothetical protein
MSSWVYDLYITHDCDPSAELRNAHLNLATVVVASIVVPPSLLLLTEAYRHGDRLRDILTCFLLKRKHAEDKEEEDDSDDEERGWCTLMTAGCDGEPQSMKRNRIATGKFKMRRISSVNENENAESEEAAATTVTKTKITELQEVKDEQRQKDMKESRADALLFVVLHTAIASWTFAHYTTTSPTGGGLECMIIHVVASPLYKPFSPSMYTVLMTTTRKLTPIPSP